MNRRQKIIVSVVGIFIVLLALVGLTYGYFLTRIQGNTNTTSITVTTADLKLVYNDASPNIEALNILPGDTISTKKFTVFNDGNAKVSNYNVYLENVVNTFSIKEDVVYTLTCTSDDETNSPCTNQITTETMFPSLNGTLVTNTLDVGDTHTYTLTIRYKETNMDQSIDMGKKIGGKINIYDSNSINKLNIEQYLMNDTRITKNTTTPTFTNKAEYVYNDNPRSGELGMYMAEDDYGESWYFRGAQSYNYVNFAGFTWRIVRINGDGSIRLILEGTLDKVKREGAENPVGISAAYNLSYDNNAYVGYMYGMALTSSTDEIVNRCLFLIDNTITDKVSEFTSETDCIENGGKWTTNSYEATHANLVDTYIKDAVDLFYETYIESNNYHYGEYLTDTIFCGDKTVASGTGFAKVSTNYSAYNRLSNNSISPTLECAKNSEYDNSRYTVGGATTIKGVKTNGDLIHPIGLLTGDELKMAGGHWVTLNKAYYLFDAEEKDLAYYSWYTMTPYNFNNMSYIFDYTTDGRLANNSTFSGSTGGGVRPVINLRKDLIVSGGDGTSDAPYTVMLPAES